MTKRTREQINAEIAERLFGLKCIGCWEEPLERCPVHGREREFFASDHNAASLVVDDMLGKGYSFECGKNNRGWWAVFKQPLYVYADELPSAICEAALAAMDAEEAQG